jgi:hypothetical protein
MIIIKGPAHHRPKGLNHGVSYAGARFEDFEEFNERATCVCDEVCAGRWVMDYFHIHLETAEDEIMVALAL